MIKTYTRKQRFISDLTRTDNFTYEGASALFDWLEDWNMDTKGFAYYNPDDICYEYTEYISISHFMSDYDTDDWQVNNIEDFFEILAEHTQIIKIDDHHFIIQNY
jgi:hypothetical protein